MGGSPKGTFLPVQDLGIYLLNPLPKDDGHTYTLSNSKDSLLVGAPKGTYIEAGKGRLYKGQHPYEAALKEYRDSIIEIDNSSNLDSDQWCECDMDRKELTWYSGGAISP